MPNALAHLQAASDTISRVRSAADQLHDDLLTLTNDRDYTPEAKQRRMAPLLARKAELQQELMAARDRLNRADRDAVSRARRLEEDGLDIGKFPRGSTVGSTCTPGGPPRRDLRVAGYTAAALAWSAGPSITRS